MAVDLQVVFPNELLALTAIREVPAMRPRTLACTGADFRAIDEVLVNGLIAPAVVMVSSTQILVQVPDALAGELVHSVTVLSRRLVVSQRSLLRFRIGRTPTKVSGILRLEQVFLKLLFTTPGSDIFAPELGGGALVNIGESFGTTEGGAVVSEFIVSVARTQRQLLAIQARDTRLPRDERLLSAKVLQAGLSPSESALRVSIEILSQAGRTALANLTV